MRKPIRSKSQKQWLAATKAAYEFQSPPKEIIDNAGHSQKTEPKVPSDASNVEGPTPHKDSQGPRG